MCLVAVATGAHPNFPLIIAANRDELHARPSAPADWWPDAGNIYGGRDLVAAGSWLAADRRGRIALVTNYPGRSTPVNAGNSRGHLVRDFLLGNRPAGEFIGELAGRADGYAGFCLVAGEPGDLWLLATDHAGPTVRQLRDGIVAISNCTLDTPWPKTRYAEREIAAAIASGQVEPGALLALLARRETVPDAPPGDHELPQRALTPFVVGNEYGTRASSVLLRGHDGRINFVERRYAGGGVVEGESRVRYASSS